MLDELGFEPATFYAQVMLVTVNRAPLLAAPRYARLIMDTINHRVPDVPGRLWGYLILPDSLRIVVGPTDEDRLNRYVEMLKTVSSAHLLDVIRRADDDSLDAVLHYNPVWGGAIYQVWQAGYHRQVFYTEYRLSNVIYELIQLPVQMGLVEQADAWPYRWVGG